MHYWTVLSLFIGFSAMYAGILEVTKKVIMRDTGPYLTRWYLIPENSHYNVYLHKFTSSDFDEALHDHPWASVGILLKGSYKEWVPKNLTEWKSGSRELVCHTRHTFKPIYRNPETIHKIELIDNKPVWTLFLTGPNVRSWSFWCDKGPVDHKDFLDELGTSVGVGCD